MAKGERKQAAGGAAPGEHLRQVTVFGHSIRVSVRQGTEPGPPLLVCNGIGASLDLLQPFVDALDPRITVIRFDVPGVGGSPDPRIPYNFALLTVGINKLMTKYGYETYDVLGISWGGGLAQQVAFQSPRRCRRLVLVSTATGSIMVPASPMVLRKMITPRRYRDAEFAVTVAAELYGGEMRDRPDDVRTLMHAHSRVGSRRGYLLQLLAGAGWSSIPGLPFLRQRTLILAGDDDPIIPMVNAKLMRLLIPRSRLHVYSDGHLGLVTSADELAPIVADFLRAPG